MKPQIAASAIVVMGMHISMIKILNYKLGTERLMTKANDKIERLRQHVIKVT